MRVFSRSLYYIFVAGFGWLAWDVGGAIPLGIGDATMGNVVAGLIWGSGLCTLIDELQEGRTVR